MLSFRPLAGEVQRPLAHQFAHRGVRSNASQQFVRRDRRRGVEPDQAPRFLLRPQFRGREPRTVSVGSSSDSRPIAIKAAIAAVPNNAAGGACVRRLRLESRH